MERWWQKPEAGPRKDVQDALIALRQDVDNPNKSPQINLSCLGTFRQRELTQVQTTTVGEWTFGMKTECVDEEQGFFVRTLYIKLNGGLLNELSEDEKNQLILAVGEGALDQGSQIMVTQIADDALAIRQPFAVAFWHEGNTNIVTPSKKLLLQAFDPAKCKPKIRENN